MAAIPDADSIPLAPGSHSSPRQGVCVVELASMLAGEEFSDRPRVVCPVIAAFLRAWNDRAAHADRQRLRPYAERIVGSRGSRQLTRERREICLQWAADQSGHGVVRRRLRRLWTRMRIAVYCGLAPAVKLNNGAGEYAARVAFSRGDHQGAFELLDALVASSPEPAEEQPVLVIGHTGGPHPNGNGLATRNAAGQRSRNGDRPPTLNGSESAATSPERDRREREREPAR